MRALVRLETSKEGRQCHGGLWLVSVCHLTSLKTVYLYLTVVSLLTPHSSTLTHDRCPVRSDGTRRTAAHATGRDGRGRRGLGHARPPHGEAAHATVSMMCFQLPNLREVRRDTYFPKGAIVNPCTRPCIRPGPSASGDSAAISPTAWRSHCTCRAGDALRRRPPLHSQE